MVQGSGAIAPKETASRSVFISYRRLDDDPPPDMPEAGGFVRYLHQQVRWELSQLGVPDAILWRDRNMIAPNDDWPEKILDELHRADLFLAIVSRNYVNSGWCKREVSTIASRLATNAPTNARRMFRVDKNKVSDALVPEPLRTVHAIRFYEEDRETNRDEEYYWRGTVRRYNEYVKAIHELARAIYERLMELGVPLDPPVDTEPDTRTQPSAANQQTIFVAKPAADVTEEYGRLTRELVQRGYRVVPDPSVVLPSAGEQVGTILDEALSSASLSIHLLGERRGFRPDGLSDELAALQLKGAAKQAAQRATFCRLIWAPKIVPGADIGDIANRDPFEVLKRFDGRLESDQIDCDTATRFVEFVLQHLNTAQVDSNSVCAYIHSVPDDRALAVQVGRELKALGVAPLLGIGPDEGTPEEIRDAQAEMLQRARHVVVCWGTAKRPQLLKELASSSIREWKSHQPTKRRVILLIGPPATDVKHDLYELGLPGDADCVVDASDQNNLNAVLKAQVSPVLENRK
jgi:hypothetical protein